MVSIIISENYGSLLAYGMKDKRKPDVGCFLGFEMRSIYYIVATLLSLHAVAANPVIELHFDGSDARPVSLEKGAQIVSCEGHGKCLRLESARVRAVAKDVANALDLLSVKRPFTAMIRIRPDAGVVSDSMAAMAKVCNSRRMTKFVGAMRDGRWHLLVLTFDPSQCGKEYSVYLDWDDSKSPRRFTSTYPKDSGAKISLPLVVRDSEITLGGSLSWGFYSLDYKGLIDDVAIYDTALSSEKIQSTIKQQCQQQFELVR